MESGVLWCSQDLDLSLLPLVFSLILTVASRLLLIYSMMIKTCSLMMKSFFTVRDTQRGTQSYMEKLEERDRGDQEEKWENQKGESKPASNHFPMFSPQSGPSRDVHGVTQRREEGGR